MPAQGAPPIASSPPTPLAQTVASVPLPAPEVAPPSFSIVVPTCDRPRELAACLAALAALDYPVERYEVIVVDDGSRPPVVPIALPCRPGLRVTWLRQPNAGPASARNAGARAAAGDILAFTDDDCAPAPGWLHALAAAVTREPWGLHGGAVENALPDNACSAASHAIVDVLVPHLIDARSELRFVTSNNVAMTAERFRAIGGFDASFRTAEDRELCQRWLLAGQPVLRVAAAIVRHRHDLTLPAFWRQHFGYGRGACRFHRQRKARGLAPFRPDVALVARTFRRQFAEHPPSRAMRIAALLVVWQLANATGYLWQRVSGDRPRPSSRA
ncbi:Chondroitin synthase [Burkholderiales bacterium]|nr:Chondroitin synthase [Burkholderiales bacterium]